MTDILFYIQYTKAYFAEVYLNPFHTLNRQSNSLNQNLMRKGINIGKEFSYETEVINPIIKYTFCLFVLKYLVNQRTD